MKKLGISLRGLLLLVTAIGLFLGYSQWRRHSVLKVCAGLEKDGYVFSIPNEWRDYGWQRKPTIGTVKTLDGVRMVGRIYILWGTPVYIEDPDPMEIERLEKLGMVNYE